MLHPRRGRLHGPHARGLAAITQCRGHSSILRPIRLVLRYVATDAVRSPGLELTLMVHDGPRIAGPVPSLLATYIATITPREVYGARLGTSRLPPSTSPPYTHLPRARPGSVYIFVSIATLIGTPTGGALLRVADEEHFRALIVFTGVVLAAGTIALVGSAIAGDMRIRGKLGLRSRTVERI